VLFDSRGGWEWFWHFTITQNALFPLDSKLW